MPKYRTRPATHEAFRVGSSPIYPDWLRDAITANIVVTHAAAAPQDAGWGDAFDSADINGFARVARAERGAWIIKGIDGELHVCDAWLFAEIYEVVAAK